MKVLIVDDEKPARDRLLYLLEQLPDVEAVGAVGDGASAVESTQQLLPDTVLLDIRMPGIDGLEAAHHLSKLPQPPAIVFTTAYGEYALDAFEIEAVDYLLKPVRRERLATALERARRLTHSELESLHQKGHFKRRHLSSRQQGNIHLLPIETIVAFIADQKYVTAYHSEGESLLEESLKSLAEEFSEGYLRIHRNALVARSALVGIERDGHGGHIAILKGCEQLPIISRRHLSQVRKQLREKS